MRCDLGERLKMSNMYTGGQEEAVLEGGWRGISGSTVKLVGIITMFIDHLAAAVLARVLLSPGGWSDQLYDIYSFMRMVGRLGFPIFCFLLVEGFGKTGSRAKYALRMGIFALVSEIPFDLAFNATVLEFGYQNVYFTLLLGMLALCTYDFLQKHKMPTPVKWLLCGVALLLFMGLAELLQTDYGGMGVLTITVIYIFRNYKVLAIAGGCIVLTIMNLNEIPAFLTLIPVAEYNGKRGLKLKYFFYAFYPVHLLLLWLVAWFMGTSSIPVF